MGTCEHALSSLPNKQSNDDLGNEITLLAGQINAASHIEKLVRKFKTVEHQIKSSEQPKQKQDPEQARKMVSYQDDDGMWNIQQQRGQISSWWSGVIFSL